MCEVDPSHRAVLRCVADLIAGVGSCSYRGLKAAGTMSLTLLFSLVYGTAAVIALVAAAVVWPRRTGPGGTPLVPMLLATALWALCDAIELQLPTVEGKLLIAQLQYVGIVATAPCFFHVAMALSGRSARLGPLLLLAVWGVPVLSLGIVWTNAWHQWIWTDVLLPTGVLPFTI